MVEATWRGAAHCSERACGACAPEPLREGTEVPLKAPVGPMPGCKMASQVREPALRGRGEITGGIDACLFPCIKLCL